MQRISNRLSEKNLKLKRAFNDHAWQNVYRDLLWCGFVERWRAIFFSVLLDLFWLTRWFCFGRFFPIVVLFCVVLVCRQSESWRCACLPFKFSFCFISWFLFLWIFSCLFLIIFVLTAKPIRHLSFTNFFETFSKKWWKTSLYYIWLMLDSAMGEKSLQSFFESLEVLWKNLDA